MASERDMAVGGEEEEEEEMGLGSGRCGSGAMRNELTAKQDQ